MGPDGAYRTHFTHATTLDAMAERLAGMLQKPTSEGEDVYAMTGSVLQRVTCL